MVKHLIHEICFLSYWHDKGKSGDYTYYHEVLTDIDADRYATSLGSGGVNYQELDLLADEAFNAGQNSIPFHVFLEAKLKGNS